MTLLDRLNWDIVFKSRGDQMLSFKNENIFISGKKLLLPLLLLLVDELNPNGDDGGDGDAEPIDDVE